MDIPIEVLVKLASQGSVAIIFFLAWWYTEKQYRRITEKIFEVLEKDRQYKELLVGILTRMEAKLDIALRNIPSDRRKNNEE